MRHLAAQDVAGGFLGQADVVGIAADALQEAEVLAALDGGADAGWWFMVVWIPLS